MKWFDEIEFLFSTISIMFFNYGLPGSSILIQGWNDLKVPFLRDIDRERKEWGERVLEGDGRISWRHVQWSIILWERIPIPWRRKGSTSSYYVNPAGSRSSILSLAMPIITFFRSPKSPAGWIVRNFTLSSGVHYAHENGVKPGLFILDFSNNFCRKFKR